MLLNELIRCVFIKLIAAACIVFDISERNTNTIKFHNNIGLNVNYHFGITVRD